jgi:hypothetical protein
MAKVTIKETLDAGADVLVVRGTVDLVEVAARGWMSAMTNHYDPSGYEDIPESTEDAPHDRAHGRHLKKDATPREMTREEKRAYCERLLLEAAGKSAVGPKPVELF